MSSKFSARLSLVLGSVNEITFFSYFGQKIQHESQLISDKVYYSNWYRFNTSDTRALRDFRRMIQLTILRANRAFEISAGGLTNMSYQTCMNVIES